MNKYIKENVRHRAFNSCLSQFPRIFFSATRAILYPTTEKNHPVLSMQIAMKIELLSTNLISMCSVVPV